MKVQTSSLTGRTLDYAVAVAEGGIVLEFGEFGKLVQLGFGVEYSPSTDWAQGGPIIERERLDTSPGFEYKWNAIRYDHLLEDDGLDCFMGGDTLLEAAMRCYVASKLGSEVDIPDELINR